jgi:selenocysteine lyase/cysteine desulfurase
MSIPVGCSLRPAYTGWFSDFGKLSGAQGDAVGYGDAAMRFWGATFDASGLYRFNAVMRWLHDLGVTPREIHAHAAGLERRFLDGIGAAKLALLPAEALTPPARFPRGNFLAFDLDGAEEVERRLAARGVLVDRRGRRVRFGFGVYHDDAFIDRLLERTKAALG